MTIGFVYFYKVSFQHLVLLAKTWGLSLVLKGSSFWSYLSNIFRRRLQSCQQNISPANLCASCWSFSFRSIFSAVSCLVFGMKAMSELESIVRAPLNYLGSLWWFNVSKNYRIKPFLLQAAYWEVFCLTYFLLVSWRIIFRQVASLLFDRILGVSVFHHVMWGGEDKMEVIEEFVINVLLFF